jgi:hypothetical protein
MQQRSLQQVRVSVSLIFLIHGLIIATWASRIPAFQAHGSAKAGHNKADWLAHISQNLLATSPCNGRGTEGDAGTDAAFNNPRHSSHLVLIRSFQVATSRCGGGFDDAQDIRFC